MENWLFLTLSLPGLALGGHQLWQRGRALMARRATDSYLDAVLAEVANLSVRPSPVPATFAAPVAPRVVVASVAAATAPCADHSVELYEDDAEIVTSVADFYERGLAAGDPIVLVATAAHRHAVEATLASRGHDLRTARYHALDAQETLDSLCVDGVVDAALFDTVVGGIVRDLVSQGDPVHIYGEMVGLLWGDGDVVGAMRLETLCNALRTHVPFTLHCGYGLTAQDDRAGLAALCRLHDATIGARVGAATRG